MKTRGEEHGKSRFPFHANQRVLNIILLKFSSYLIFLSSSWNVVRRDIKMSNILKYYLS